MSSSHVKVNYPIMLLLNFVNLNFFVIMLIKKIVKHCEYVNIIAYCKM